MVFRRVFLYYVFLYIDGGNLCLILNIKWLEFVGIKKPPLLPVMVSEKMNLYLNEFEHA